MDIFRIKTSEIFRETPVGIGGTDNCKIVKKTSGRSYLNMTRADIRSYVRLSFLPMTPWIGTEFYLFKRKLEHGEVATINHLPGVEGLLPVSALVGLRCLLLTGIVYHIFDDIDSAGHVL